MANPTAIEWADHTFNPWWGCARRTKLCLMPRMNLDGIHWLIVGGESGPRYRPMDLAWLADIVAQCDAAGVPVFVKQDSGFRDGRQGRLPCDLWRHKEFPRISVPPTSSTTLPLFAG